MHCRKRWQPTSRDFKMHSRRLEIPSSQQTNSHLILSQTRIGPEFDGLMQMLNGFLVALLLSERDTKAVVWKICVRVLCRDLPQDRDSFLRQTLLQDRHGRQDLVRCPNGIFRIYP